MTITYTYGEHRGGRDAIPLLGMFEDMRSWPVWNVGLTTGFTGLVKSAIQRRRREAAAFSPAPINLELV